MHAPVQICAHCSLERISDYMNMAPTCISSAVVKRLPYERLRFRWPMPLTRYDLITAKLFGSQRGANIALLLGT